MNDILLSPLAAACQKAKPLALALVEAAAEQGAELRTAAGERARGQTGAA